MSPLQPVALFGLEVPPGDILVPVAQNFPATVSRPIIQSSSPQTHGIKPLRQNAVYLAPSPNLPEGPSSG